MILNEKEVQSCLIYICEKLFTDKLKIIEADLKIQDRIHIDAKVMYELQPIDLSASFLMDYKNDHIYVYDINAKVEYLMFKLNFMNLIKHALRDYPATIKQDSIVYTIDLPIEKIELGKQYIDIKIK